MSCEGCQRRHEALEKKVDQLRDDLYRLTDRLNPLIEFAAAFIESPAGKLQRALRRKSG